MRLCMPQANRGVDELVQLVWHEGEVATDVRAISDLLPAGPGWCCTGREDS